ncbi:Protein Star [Folsomia candida]|uniref:Protein Star n=1 Tax=Folsomia candida TaxID=158441 RepID=A0A226DHN3_FOLCA|nr:Protein Star [Folsomia candida]
MQQHKSITGWTHLSESDSFNGKSQDYREFEAQCFPFYSLLRAINVTTVDYFSLDIEGAELSILKTIPWKDTFSIEVRNEIEHNLRDYMTSVGYRFVAYVKNRFSHDHIYAHSSLGCQNDYLLANFWCAEPPHLSQVSERTGSPSTV